MDEDSWALEKIIEIHQLLEPTSYICIYLYIYVLYIYILYSISPFSFLRLFLFFLPFIVSFIKSWWFIPQLSRLWGANLTTSTLTAQGTMTIDQVDVQNLARSVDRWQLPKLLGLHWQLVLSGERGVPTPSLHKRVQKAADSWWAAFWCWWFFWKKIWRAAKETLIGLDMESYGNVRILFPWIPRQFGHVHSKTVWTFERKQRIRRACVTLPSNSELVWWALKHDLSQTRRLHNFHDAAFKVKQSSLHE